MKKTLLIDMNNLVTRCIYSAPVLAEKELTFKYKMWKYIVFECIISTIRKFKPQEIILCVDSPHCWRKDFYSIYKENRITKRKEDDFDWEYFFREYNTYLEELKVLPFNIVKVDRTEADDIIAVLTLYLTTNDIIIISTDKDYKQLLSHKHCKIYDPIKKEYITLDVTPEDFLLHEIITGQTKDNVGNILTPLTWDKRKPPLGDKKLKKILEEGIECWLDNNLHAMKKKYDVDIKERFEQNRKILDLKEIPEVYKKEITSTYSSYECPDLEKMYAFFKEQNWPSILDNYNYIENLLLGVC